MNTNQNPVLRTVSLTKRFGELTAIQDLDLEVRPGEVFGFLGPNGSGKSTTIGMVLGLLQPTHGHVELFGEDLSRASSDVLQRVGALLENSPLYPYLSGRDHLELVARLARRKDPAKINGLMEAVGLASRAGSKVKTYSLGMKQRLSLAMSLLSDPDLIVLDEPTNGMDANGMIEVRELIRRLGQEGKAVFLSSHLLHEVEQVCTSVAIVKQGKVLAQGTLDELLRQGASVQIRVSEVEQALSILKEQEWVESASAKNGLLVVKAPSERTRDITTVLAVRGIYPTEIRPLENPLEIFFREITQEEAQEKGQLQ